MPGPCIHPVDGRALADLWWRDGANVLRLWAGLTGDEVVLEVSNVLNALGAFERVDEVERTEVFGESFANRLRGSLCVAEVGSDDFEASLASGEVSLSLSQCMWLLRTFPEEVSVS